MKKLLLAAVKFIFRSLGFLALAYGFSLLTRLAGSNASVTASFMDINVLVARDVLSWSVPILAMSGLVSLFSILHLPKLRFVARFFLWMVLGASLFGVFLAWTILAAPGTESGDLRYGLLPATVFRSRTVHVFTGEVEGPGIKSLWYRQTRVDEGIVRALNPRLADGNRRLEIAETGAVIDLTQLGGSYHSLAEGPADSQEELLLSGGRSIMRQYMDQASRGLIWMILNAASLSMAIVGLWFWVRLSRWPLWNALWGFLLLGFMYAGLTLVFDPSSLELMAEVHPLLPQLAPPILWILMATIWSLLSLLQPPFKDWKREVGQ